MEEDSFWLQQELGTDLLNRKCIYKQDNSWSKLEYLLGKINGAYFNEGDYTSRKYLINHFEKVEVDDDTQV